MILNTSQRLKSLKDSEIMKDFLIDAKRKLTKEEQGYRDKFIDIMCNKYNYIPQKDEKFIQQLDFDKRGDKYRFFNPQRFVSNYGYVFSVRKDFIIMKPMLKIGGDKSVKPCKSKWTTYIQKIHPKWEKDMNEGYIPKYYEYENTYPHSHKLLDAKDRYRCPMHKLIAFYFDKKGYNAGEKNHDVHHDIQMDWSKSPQQNNNIFHLMTLSRKQHHKLHSNKS